MSEPRVCLVTGSSRGLGRAVALELGRLGYTVAVHYVHSEAPAAEVVREIRALGARAELFRADVSQEDACVALIKEVQERCGSLDVLVNNAGITKDALAIRLKAEDWRQVLETNLSSAFYLSKTALRGMLGRKWGRIINISSVVALNGNPGQANYIAAKAGLIGLSKALAQEYGAKGVTVNTVAPGFITSDMTSGLPDELKKNYLLRIPANRFGEAKEVAAAVAFFASEGASYVNGQTLAVDGGMVMH